MVLNPVNEDFEDYYSPANEEFLNESTQLDEMALCEVSGFRNDRFIVISKDPDHLPLHAYVFSTVTNENLGDFLVTKNLPKKVEDIETFRSEIPEDAKRMIVERAGRASPFLSKVNNWGWLKALCTQHLQRRFRPD